MIGKRAELMGFLITTLIVKALTSVLVAVLWLIRKYGNRKGGDQVVTSYMFECPECGVPPRSKCRVKWQSMGTLSVRYTHESRDRWVDTYLGSTKVEE